MEFMPAKQFVSQKELEENRGSAPSQPDKPVWRAALFRGRGGGVCSALARSFRSTKIGAVRSAKSVPTVVGE